MRKGTFLFIYILLISFTLTSCVSNKAFNELKERVDSIESQLAEKALIDTEIRKTDNNENTSKRDETEDSKVETSTNQESKLSALSLESLSVEEIITEIKRLLNFRVVEGETIEQLKKRIVPESNLSSPINIYSGQISYLDGMNLKNVITGFSLRGPWEIEMNDTIGFNSNNGDYYYPRSNYATVSIALVDLKTAEEVFDSVTIFLLDLYKEKKRIYEGSWDDSIKIDKSGTEWQTTVWLTNTFLGDSGSEQIVSSMRKMNDYFELTFSEDEFVLPKEIELGTQPSN